jgi:hypothetical protein
MKSFKSIREGYSVEPGVSAIDDVPEDPMSFIEIKPKKTKVVKGDLKEAVSVKKEKHSWGTMMTVHHGSDTSYPLHPEHQSAIKKLRPGMKTTFKDETNSSVHAHREGDTVHLTRPKTGSTVTALPYHHFDTSEHAKPAAKKPAGEYDRKVADHLKKKYNEDTEQIDELDKSTLTSYIKKASRDAADSANYAGFERERHGRDSKEDRPRTYGVAAKNATRRLKGIEGASNRLAGVKTLKDEGTRHIVHYKGKNTSTFRDNAEKVADIGKSIKRNHADKVHTVSGSRETGNGYVELTHSSHAAAIKDHIKKAGGKVTREKTMAGGHYYNEDFVTEKTLSELKKTTLGSYIKKASDSATMSAYGAGGESERHAAKPVSTRPDTYGADRKAALKRLKGIGKATDRLTKEENMVETKGAPKGFHFTKDGKLKRGDANQDGDGGTMLRADPLDKQRSKVPAVSEGIDFAAIWNSIKPVHEEVKTTHEDPLVVTKDSEGHIHTHANLSVANAIHGTDVKHQAIHTGKPVQGGKFTFELSKHHERALKEDAPFDPVAHKKELDQLMGKHMAAHTETTKLINAKAPQEAINKAQERNNAVKQEIRNHKDKVPKGPAPKPGSAADYYANKKPGEYTGD